MRNLVLIRGLPGSGKTTLAKRLFPNYRLCEADQYFTDDNGDYFFDPTQLPDAHADCLKRATELLDQGYDVVVCNTFIKKHHTYPYLRLRTNSKLVIVANGEFESVHNVPRATVVRMREEFEL
jgi:predicted kinase